MIILVRDIMMQDQEEWDSIDPLFQKYFDFCPYKNRRKGKEQTKG